MAIYAFEEHHPQLPEPGHFWIAPGAQVIGRVRLGRDVSLWFGVVVRGDSGTIEIGDTTNVQDGAVLHSDPGFPLQVGAGCTVGHRAILHGCTVGDNTLVGMGATVLNGARIGNNCLIGANALVTEGKEFPDGSLIVGSPAKAVRTLDAAAIEGLRASARGYAEKWRRYSTGLKHLDDASR